MTAPADHAATWITDQSTLEAWLAELADGDSVGLDTEFTRRNTFHPQLSLLQLAHAGRYALVDPLAFDLGNILQHHLGERPVTCVMHSAGEDLETLAPWLPQGPSTLFDTQLAAAFAGLGHGLGYRALVAELCHVELDKGETRSDWNRRPLSDSQLRYATLDVVYLAPIHATLVQRLHARNREAWCAADCESLKHRAHPDALPDQPQCELRAAATWPREQQALLRRILIWRERNARELDKPHNWLLDNAHALDVVHHVPANAEQLAQATRGQRALRRPQREQLLDALRQPLRPDELATTATISGRPDAHARHTLQAMKQVVDELADDFDIPGGLLCPRKALVAWLTTQHWPESLDGWRRDVLEVRLQPLLAGQAPEPLGANKPPLL